ncbi:MAG: M48 family metalloprotease [Candidatus Methanoperedens sp.]|nr:M48 family metalloprotease [Candidatus Methanoperedens sp.]MCZ7371667.1 M48 family metalloprotease [Candidatus Methanoperedens sp.]
MNENDIRLNPFVYISETDIRFYLMVLIGIIVPSLWALIFAIVIFYVMAGAEITLILRLLIVIPIFLFIPILIYRDYKKSTGKIEKESKLKEFDPKKYPEHHEYIEKLHSEYFSREKKPVLMVQPLDASKSAFTFGTKNHMYIGIPGGLIKMFRENLNGFKTIFLHEMGHIVNRDVEKTYLANSTWRSLFLTLSVPLGIFLLYEIYLALSIFYLGNLAGYDMDYIISKMDIGKRVALYGGIIIYFIIFLGVIYVLRNQIIRIREFYADARVVEWERSPENIVKTLEESGGEQYSKFELLKKFHPNINERIQILKNNLSLFDPSLWIAFSIGFFYGLIELSLPFFNQIFSLSSSEWAAMANENYQSSGEIYIGLRAIISVFIVPVLMLPVSLSFHKSILRDTFIEKKNYFSSTTISNLIKFSMAFSLGWLTNELIYFPAIISLYEINTIMSNLLDIAKAWFWHALYFSIVLLYILIFSSILIRRSFNKKEAVKNFIFVSILSSFLYILIRFYAIETLNNKPLTMVFFFVFSCVTYIFIKIKDKKLSCPSCNDKIDFSVFRRNCPNCQQNLYPWAIYSFS